MRMRAGLRCIEVCLCSACMYPPLPGPPGQLHGVCQPPLLQQPPQQAGQHRLALRQRVEAQRLRRGGREGAAAHGALRHPCTAGTAGQQSCQSRFKHPIGLITLGGSHTTKASCLNPTASTQHTQDAQLQSQWVAASQQGQPGDDPPTTNTKEYQLSANPLDNRTSPSSLATQPFFPATHPSLSSHPPMMDTSASDTPMGYTSRSNSSSGSVELAGGRPPAAPAVPAVAPLVGLSMAPDAPRPSGVAGSHSMEGNQSCRRQGARGRVQVGGCSWVGWRAAKAWPGEVMVRVRQSQPASQPLKVTDTLDAKAKRYKRY